MNHLKGSDLLSTKGLTLEDLRFIFGTTTDLKMAQKRGEIQEILKNKVLAMIFEIPSTRTSISFETAMTKLGGHAIYLGTDRYWAGKAKEESWLDTCGTIDRYADALAARVMSHDDLVKGAEKMRIPVINASNDYEHPCQALTDFQTVLEKRGRFEGLKYVITWAWRHSNPPIGLVNSSMHIAAKLGMEFVIACPEGYEPLDQELEAARAEASKYGSEINIVHDMRGAARGADFLNIYSWVSPEVFRKGIETHFAAPAPHNEFPEKYQHWKVTPDVVDLLNPAGLIMHCMPAARGEEVVDEVLDGSRSIIFDEAENRLHVQKALLALLMG
ncbi:MAG: ornithine carbamoyltransferase [Bacillota bacterium]